MSQPKKPSQNWLTTIRDLLPFLSPHAFTISVVIIMLLINSIIVVAVGFGVNYVIEELVSSGTDATAFQNKVLIYALAAILLTALLKFTTGYLLVRVASQVTEAIRCRVFDNITDQKLAYFDKQHSGELQTRIVADINIVGQFICSQIPVNLSSLIQLAGGLAGAILINAKLTGTVLLAIPLLFLPFFIVAIPIQKISKALQTATSDLGKFAGESFRNVKIVQAYNKETQEKKRFAELAKGVVKQSLRRALIEQAVGKSINALALTGAALLLWISAKNISQGVMTVGQLASFSYFVYLIVIAASQFVNSVSSLNSVIGSAAKIVGYLRLEKLIWPSKESELTGQSLIEFDKVHFSYPNRPETQVIHGVSLTVHAGSSVAIVGPSGAGKSTLFELLLRFYDFKHGVIRINGIDIKDFDVAQVRSAIGFVPQKECLVSGTVLENICFGIDKLEEETARAAARRVNMDEFIMQLPEGYSTDLGEVGNRLSGGQKQRIALARALSREPRILLLDEANSALDIETDRFVAHSIQRWAKDTGATVLTIAHRLETAKHMDQIVVMKDGQVVGIGRHEELLVNCPVYQVLSLQMENNDTVSMPQSTEQSTPEPIDDVSTKELAKTGAA